MLMTSLRKMPPQIDFQYAVDENLRRDIPDEELISQWIQQAFNYLESAQLIADNGLAQAEICIRYVETLEIQELNATYRQKNQPTNILSFPSDLPDYIDDVNMLGDLVVSPKVIIDEARGQHKALNDHWAHILIHGVLHLCGYDHIEDAQALEMESHEIHILNKLGISNPYEN